MYMNEEDEKEINEIAKKLVAAIEPIFVDRKIRTSMVALNKVHAAIVAISSEDNEEILERQIKLIEENFAGIARSIFKGKKMKEKDNVQRTRSK